MKTVELGEVAVIERTVRQPDQIRPGTRYIGLENIESGGELVDVRAVDALGLEARSASGGHLIPHECEQRGDYESGSAASLSQRAGCGPVHGAFAPAGGLDHKDTSGRFENGIDCGELVGAGNGVPAGQTVKDFCEML